jgi:cytochrome c553
LLGATLNRPALPKAHERFRRPQASIVLGDKGRIFLSAAIAAQGIYVALILARPDSTHVDVREFSGCISCHGNGMSPSSLNNVPGIAGQNFEYLVQALNAYRNGERIGYSAKPMVDVAKELAPVEIPVVAAFFSNLRPVR